MKISLRHFALLAALLPLRPAQAALDPNLLPADTKWVVYADLNALRATAIGKELIAVAEKAQQESTKGTIGVDIPKLLTTVGTVTVYGSNFSSDPKVMDGAMIIQGTPDLRKIAEAALLQATITTPERVAEVTDLPFPAYAISAAPAKAAAPAADKNADATKEVAPVKEVAPAKPAAPAQFVVIAFPPEPIVLVSKSKSQLLRARDVFRGKVPALAKADGSPLAGLLGNAGNAYLFSASVAPPAQLISHDDAPQTRILQMVSAGSAAIGEKGPLTYAHIELQASSDQMADKLTKILQGMTAMVSLAETSDKDLAEFMNSAAVARNDRTVTLDLSYSSTRLAQMIQNLRAPTSAPGVTSRDRGVALGKVVAEWKSPQEPAKPDAPPPPETLLWQTVENIHLTPATLITLTARTNGRVIPGKNARFDRIEISPSQGAGTPLIFRAEYMKIIGGFSIDRPSAVTGGRALAARTPVSTAQFQFPGGEGTYTLRVAYLTGADENTTMALNIKDPTPPAPAAAPETKANDDAAKRGAP